MAAGPGTVLYMVPTLGTPGVCNKSAPAHVCSMPDLMHAFEQVSCVACVLEDPVQELHCMQHPLQPLGAFSDCSGMHAGPGIEWMHAGVGIIDTFSPTQ